MKALPMAPYHDCFDGWIHRAERGRKCVRLVYEYGLGHVLQEPVRVAVANYVELLKTHSPNSRLAREARAVIDSVAGIKD